MTVPRFARTLAMLMLLALGLSPLVVRAQVASPSASPATTLTPQVVASGLTNPRGMIWGADGTLFVALAGSGGPNAPTETYPTSQLEATFRGGLTGAVASINPAGCPVLVAGGLPSTSTPNGDALGAEDVAILGDQLYASVDGGGAMHGNEGTPSGVYRLISDGSSVLVADLSAWVRANPVSNVQASHDFDAAGYSIVADAAANLLWVSDPNSGQILSVTPDGVVARVADMSAGHMVLTQMVADPNGGVYVGTLTAVPFPDGAAKVVHVDADGTVTDVWTGLTAVTGVAVGADGSLYAIELSTGNLPEPPFLQPGSGRLVHQTGPDTSEVVVDGLMLPVAIDVGPDGAFYISLPAVLAGDGSGVIVRVALDGSAPATTADPACAPLPETLFVPGTPEAAPATPESQVPVSTPESQVPVSTPVAVDVTGATPESTPVAQVADVSIENFSFVPQTLEISAGTTVVWTNNDTAAHTATATDASWDAGNIDPGASASITFDTPGTYTYVCSYHPSMTATIIVT